MPESIDPQRLRLTEDGRTGGVLLGMRCLDCGVTVFGPCAFCQNCTSDRLEPVELAKTGVLYSYTVVRVPPAGWPGPVPYVLGQVDLPEGPQVLAEVIGCEHDQLKIGMPVELALQAVPSEGGEEKLVYKWRPISPVGGGTTDS